VAAAFNIDGMSEELENIEVEVDNGPSSMENNTVETLTISSELAGKTILRGNTFTIVTDGC